MAAAARPRGYLTCMSDLETSSRRRRRAILISVSIALSLTLIKALIFVLTHSVAMLSETLHSGTDLVAVVLAFLAIRRATAPPRVEYRYGQGRAENLSAFFEGGVIAAAAVAIVVEAISALIHPRPLHAPLLGTAVMIAAAIIYTFLAIFLRREARLLSSPALKADSQHVLVDVIAALGVGIGLAAVSITGFDRLDPIIALFVAAVVLVVGYSLIREALRQLLDISLPAAELADIRAILQKPLPGVTGYHRLRTRRGGSRRHIDFHLTFEPDLTIQRAHTLASEIESSLHERFEGLDVVIHLEPAQEAPAIGADSDETKPQSRPLTSLPSHSLERKFLLAKEPPTDLLHKADTQILEIEQHYLLTDGDEERVRRVWREEEESFFWTHKVSTPGLDRELVEREIDLEEYGELLLRRDESRYPIRKTRYSFAYAGNLFELDIFALPARLQILEVELPSADSTLLLPSGFVIEREVTHEESFLNAAIAQGLAAKQRLSRAEWLTQLEPGEVLWVLSRSANSEYGGYGSVVLHSSESIEVSVQERQIVFDPDGRAFVDETEMVIERPGEVLS